ncbi:MAG: FtsX-like permease family protein [Bacteroidetes bacterium]|nr:FtsX-like permease family protein [Bacteroidota bacterium]MDA0972252.1 FtsX-like permease family protein [Bacteroidota bacterium]
MRFPFYIAERYLFSKKSRNVINLITGISVAVIAFVTAAMIVVLSAFNGIDMLVDELYSSFDGDVIIEAPRGRYLDTDRLNMEAWSEDSRIAAIHEVVEQSVLVQYKDRQRVAVMKGVPADYMTSTGLENKIYEGGAILEDEDTFRGIIGYGILLDLDAALYSESLTPLFVHAAEKGRRISRDKEKAFNTEPIMIGGVFSINLEYDSQYLLVPIAFARDVMKVGQVSSYLEVQAKEGVPLEELKDVIASKMSQDLKVSTREEKNALVYKANESERLVTILILSFIILIATFNILASITMLMLDKQKDLKIIHSMGATVQQVRNIFFIEAMLISVAGTVIGLVLGLGVCFLQSEYGLVPLQGGIVDYYPVIIMLRDVLMVFAIVVSIGFLFSWFPVKRLTKGLLAQS